MDRERLARTLIRAAMSFYDRAPWRHLAADLWVAVRVPDAPLPVFVSVMGRAEPRFGLRLFRGANALTMARQAADPRSPEHLLERWDFAELLFEAPHKIAEPFEEILRAGHFHGSSAPLMFTKAPGQPARPLRKPDQETMLWVLLAVLHAEDQGLFRPASLGVAGEVDVWTVTIGGRTSKPEVRAKFETYAPQEDVAAVDDARELRSATSPPVRVPATVIPAPDDLLAWKDLDFQVTHLLAREAKLRGLVQARVLGEFAGEGDSSTDAELFHAAMEWLVTFRRVGKGATLAETLAADAEQPVALRQVLAARAACTLSLYRIEANERGVGLGLVDVLTGEQVFVHDRIASESAPVSATFFATTYRVGQFTFCSIMSPSLGLFNSEACTVLQAAGVTLTHAGLRSKARLLGLIWTWHRQRTERDLQITNTDGEQLESITASFAVADIATLLQALRARDDIDERIAGEEFMWLRQTARDSTVLARLQIVVDQLVVEVNSDGRLRLARELMAALGGLRELHVTKRPFGDTGVPPDAKLRSAEPQREKLSVADLATALRPRYMGWLDEPIPAFGGKTPRQAARTKAGRDEVARLIRSYPDPLGPDGPMMGVVPREEMLRELGLD